MGTHRQNGQALSEALVVLVALASMWAGVAWLGQLQDIRQQLAHISRHAAFAWAHQEMGMAAMAQRANTDLQAKGNQWQTRQGARRLSSALVLRIESDAMAQAAQIGSPDAKARVLHAQWQLGQNAIWVAHAQAATGTLRQPSQALHDFDLLALPLSQHTAILRGHGAANSDSAVKTILSGSEAGWLGMQQASERAGRHVAERVAAVDAAWSRPAPVWDWLSSWEGQVPPRYLERAP